MGVRMADREESDQLPEEGPESQVPDDDRGGERDQASESAGVPGGEGQDEEGQASGNPGSAG
jgi:hypothetical protein